jgi:glycosyltransferase involved in cell wall biosynthesis
VKKLEILWASPLPPTRSGVADYAEELLPELAKRAEVTVIEPPGWRADERGGLLATLPRRPADQPFPPHAVPLLHMGNNPHHIWIARLLRERRGVVVLHDSVLHHLLVEDTVVAGEWDAFESDLREAEGRGGGALALARRWGYSGPSDPFLFPARSAYLRFASGIVVHSRRAARDVAACCPDAPVRRVPLAVAELPSTGRAAARAALALREDELLLVHLGFLTPAKGMGVILEAVAALRDLRVPVRLTVAGEGSEGDGLARAIASLGLRDHVALTGWTSKAALGDLVVAADLGLVPRHPTAGETSAAALRFLAAGTPVVVAGHRQFLELPEDAAPRVTPGRAGIAELVRVVAVMARGADRRSAARLAARRAWESGGHEPGRAAEGLLRAVEELRAGVAR